MIAESLALRTRKDMVAHAIRDSILRGEYKPGDKLDQQQVADELEVSRSPVREALRALDAEGLVTLIPNRGAVVTQRSLPELQELFATRSILEGTAIERAAPHIDAKRLARLSGILQAADHTDDHSELLLLNNDFHMTAYGAYPQVFLIDYIQQLRNMAGPYNRLYMDSAGSRQAAWDDHRRIYQACAAHDARRARAEIEGHLQRVIDRIVSAIQQSNPDSSQNRGTHTTGGGG